MDRTRLSGFTDPRAKRLQILLNSILDGKKGIDRHNASLFIQALCTKPDPATCVDAIIASPAGLAAIQASMRVDTSLTFLNGSATSLLDYIQAPDLKMISGGEFLRQIILKIVEPPIFWTPFTRAYKAGTLETNGQRSFAWLLLQLIALPADEAKPYRTLAEDPSILNSLLSSPHLDIRNIAQSMKHLLTTVSTFPVIDIEDGPGGRHDNDFSDFRQIAIIPTADEIMSAQPPFLRHSEMLEDPETEKDRIAMYLDNQFRLLREEMIYEMREETQIITGKKKGHSRGFTVNGLTVVEIHPEDPNGSRYCQWGIAFKCKQDLWQFTKDKPKNRKAYLNDNRNIFRHQSSACLIIDGEIIAFPTVNRDEDLLARRPPIVVLQFEGETSVVQTLVKMKAASQTKLVQIDSAIFSFAPILKGLQETQCMPLTPELLFWKDGNDISHPLSRLARIVHEVQTDHRRDLRTVLQTTKPVLLDESQAESFVSGLTQKVSLIQGPPGTGKSFIGALLGKALHDNTTLTILVVCYTNHALDQFLEDLLDIGIPQSSIVRLGGKYSPRTEPLTLQKQNGDFRLRRADWVNIDRLKLTSKTLLKRLHAAFSKYESKRVFERDLLDYLEVEEPTYFEAFHVPKSGDGMTKVGSKGKEVSPFYLLSRWSGGHDAGIFQSSPHVQKASQVWGASRHVRISQSRKWKHDILKEQAAEIFALGKEYDACTHKLDRIFDEKDADIMRSKRIIACTTTAAAKYRESIQAASPGVLLVEEAGEILESHILTALGPQTKQLILIGDHKQLRPKVNHYLLTVEKGEGYDLNRSLFERLVLKGFPHKTLTEQHRMRPEISSLIRHLTYPDLVDAASTKGRPHLRGIQDDIVFIDHDHPEDETSIADQRDMNSTSSKQNSYEVEMVLKILRYLGQQGYGTEKVVILTPYLGQLHKLRDALKNDNDPVLNDLDSYDLVRAGLLPTAAANVKKNPIRLATIDNYQGEESDIVLASLTRSNASHDIGFMASPERLNVLLSRARDGLIILGNSTTFLNARKGKDLWNSVFTLLKNGRHIYDGLPVRCERHPSRTAVLSQAAGFDTECPDGGCKEPCDVMLNCGFHKCPSKCHQLSDHSKMACQHIMDRNCAKGHRQTWKCHENIPVICIKCENAATLAEEERREAAALQQRRDAEDLVHAKNIAEINAKIALEEQALRDTQLAQERAHAIQQRKADLEAITSRASRTVPAHQVADGALSVNLSAPAPTIQRVSQPSAMSTLSTLVANNMPEANPEVPEPPRAMSSEPVIISLSQEEWQRKKDIEGATNDAIDGIMELTGLEEVKKQVMRINAKIEATTRQGTSLKCESFNIVLLGNPGTGKTTVARLYAKFLSSVAVLPGSEFIETTGSRLSNDGVAGVKKHIEILTNAGGGALFVDEAYQLTSQHNFQGSQVLDFLLAEMENHVGTIVFILAGYDKQMEKLFEYNPGLRSRVPYELRFADYEDPELLSMLEKLIQKKYSGRMKVECGILGLYGRIAVRRLGRGRGREGFGNARALRTLFAKICERQAERLDKERKRGLNPDDFLLLKQDLIGCDPSEAIMESDSWRQLQSLIGLTAVKESIRNLFALINTNYQRELQEMKPVEMSLNHVFLGSPGTGKTTVARLYGQILSDLGLLSSGQVVMKNPADFIGAALGVSESNTKAILASTVGKVLIIDEAYMLYGGGSGNQNDPYKTAVIDTIVAEVQSVPGEDRCVLLLGYKDQIVEMFQNVNPGLSRRFAIENAFYFEDFTDAELLEVLNLKLKGQDLGATDSAKVVAIEVLSRSRNRPNFGNAGEVENLLGQAKGRYQTRQSSLPANERGPHIIFEPQDFDPDFNRNAHASTNLQRLFEDVVGCGDIIRRLGEYQCLATALKARGKDPRGEISTNWVFKGPPGTGKTTTARKMGRVYFDMGFLSSTEVIECSASDLVGQYVGQTGPKTRKLFEKALERVLFIDEAYRLSEGHFATEAIDELVGTLTQEKFRSKIVVILAGYDREMNELMAVNPGLSSRFPDEMIFRNLEPAQCLEVLKRELEKMNIRLSELDDPAHHDCEAMRTCLETLSCLPSWGNARDIVTLSKKMIAVVYNNLKPDNRNGDLSLSVEDALACMNSMLADRLERSGNLPTHTRSRQLDGMRRMLDPLDPPAVNPYAPRLTQTVNTSVPELSVDEAAPNQAQSHGRDPNVSDEIWCQLQLDKEASEAAARALEEEIRRLEQERRDIVKREEMQKELMAEARLAEARAQDDLERDKVRRAHEAMRIQQVRERQEREKIAALLEVEREKQRQEVRAQQKLRAMGVCVAGFRWIKQESGYRCAGGSHFVDNVALGI